MKKKLVCLLMMSGLFFVTFAQPQQKEETITITTFYPSPVGVYNRLITRALGVGDVNNDGQITETDSPDPTTNAGRLLVRGGIGIGTTNLQAVLDINAPYGNLANAIIFPRNSQAPPFPVEGMVYYNTTVQRLQVYEGGRWRTATGAVKVASGAYVGDCAPHCGGACAFWTGENYEAKNSIASSLGPNVSTDSIWFRPRLVIIYPLAVYETDCTMTGCPPRFQQEYTNQCWRFDNVAFKIESFQANPTFYYLNQTIPIGGDFAKDSEGHGGKAIRFTQNGFLVRENFSAVNAHGITFNWFAMAWED